MCSEKWQDFVTETELLWVHFFRQMKFIFGIQYL